METNTNTTEDQRQVEKLNSPVDNYRLHITVCEDCKEIFKRNNGYCYRGSNLHDHMVRHIRGEIFREINHESSFRAAKDPITGFKPIEWPPSFIAPELTEIRTSNPNHKRTCLIILGMILILSALWGGVYFARICPTWAEFPTVITAAIVMIFGCVAFGCAGGAFDGFNDPICPVIPPPEELK